MDTPLPSTLVLATGNLGKAKELRLLLPPLSIQILDLSDFQRAPQAPENGDTLADNAISKASTIQSFTGLPALADDTGLEVAALEGLPGIHSARYAGPGCDATANRAKLLHALQGSQQRQARFITVLALVNGPNTLLFRGSCSGHIAPREMTTGGFGYESIFIPDGYTRCFAQLSTKEKNAISHRGQAVRKLIDHFNRS